VGRAQRGREVAALHESLARRLSEGSECIGVTGATGWFGRVTLDLLGEALGREAFLSRVHAYASTVRSIEVTNVGGVQVRALAELQPCDVLLHYAFLTKDRVAGQGGEAFVTANLEITRRVLDSLGGALFYTSSGAARRPDVDVNPSGALKRLDEIVLPPQCPGACVVARVFNVSGAHMTKPGLYALGDLILAAREGRPLRIAAHGDVVRSYAAVSDIVQVGLAELLDGRDAFFETAGDTQVEIEELAHAVREALGREDLAVERVRQPGGATDLYVGDGSAFFELADRHGIALQSLAQQIRETAAALE